MHQGLGKIPAHLIGPLQFVMCYTCGWRCARKDVAQLHLSKQETKLPTMTIHSVFAVAVKPPNQDRNWSGNPRSQ